MTKHNEALLENEIIRPIPNYDTYYATSLGRILKKDKEGNLHEVPQYDHTRGYKQVALENKAGRKMELSHRAIAFAFYGVSNRGNVCRHLNGVKTDNRVENLRWGNHFDNWMDSIRNDERDDVYFRPKLTEDEVVEIRKRAYKGEVLTKLAEEFGVTLSSVSLITRGLRWACAGGPLLT